MTKFKRVDTANGRIMYFIDGAMKSQKDIPSHVRSLLSEPGEVELETSNDSENEQTEQPNIGAIDTKVCLFDDSEATHQKFLNQITLGLCDVHYSLTTGKIAQLLREKLTEEKA